MIISPVAECVCVCVWSHLGRCVCVEIRAVPNNVFYYSVEYE